MSRRRLVVAAYLLAGPLATGTFAEDIEFMWSGGPATCYSLQVTGPLAACQTATGTEYLLSWDAAPEPARRETYQKVLNGMLTGDWTATGAGEDRWSDDRVARELGSSEAKREFAALLWKLRGNPILDHPDRSPLGLLAMGALEPYGRRLIRAFYEELSVTCQASAADWRPEDLALLVWEGWDEGGEVLEEIGACTGAQAPVEPVVIAALGLAQLGRREEADRVVNEILDRHSGEIDAEEALELRSLLHSLPRPVAELRNEMQSLRVLSRVFM